MRHVTKLPIMKITVTAVFIVLVGFVIFVLVNARSDQYNYKVIIDNDAGADDAMAVFLALLHEKYYNGPEVVALTTVQGNVVEDQALVNNQIFLSIAGRQEIALYRGAREALVYPKTPKGDWFGHDGLGDSNITFTDLVQPKTKFAVNALIEYSKQYEGELVLIAIGPVTNIALAIKSDAGFLKRLKQLYVAGGHIHSDRHPTPEFNALMDVEAFKVVMDHAVPDLVTVLPYSQTEIFLDISKEWRENEFGAINTDIVRHLNIFERISLNQSELWYALDPAMVACVFRENLVSEIKYAKFGIETCGDNRALTTHQFVDKADANVRVFYSIEKEAYKAFLIEVFSADKRS